MFDLSGSPSTHPPAPSPVHGLQVAPSSSGRLAVSWQTGPGRTERVWTLLMDQHGALLRNVSLQNTSTSVLLGPLEPGTAYTVTVVTEAAGLQSSASIQAVTGECFVLWGLFNLFSLILIISAVAF